MWFSFSSKQIGINYILYIQVEEQVLQELYLK